MKMNQNAIAKVKSYGAEDADSCKNKHNMDYISSQDLGDAMN